jgi:RNA polymerase sigma-70 factor, ECF subfamily
VHRNVRAEPSGLEALRAAVLLTARHAGLAPWWSPLLADGGPSARSRPSLPAPRTAAGPPLRILMHAAEASLPASGSNGSRTYSPTSAVDQRVVALVNLAKEGDTEAFAGLYDSYLDTVYRYVYYRVGSKALAEDLTSETFLRALRRISTFTWQGRDFGAWLLTIARNLVADHFKSSRFRLEVTTGEMLDPDEVEDGPEESVLEALSTATLIEAIKKLNAQQQECVTLRFLQGLSVAETAKIMGKNEGAIKTLQYRSVRTLARLLPEDMR